MIGELCFQTISGRGAEGYDEALKALRGHLDATEGT